VAQAFKFEKKILKDATKLLCQCRFPRVAKEQGDQIGRNFAYWVTVFFG
jgi:hypothetical protein